MKAGIDYVFWRLFGLGNVITINTYLNEYMLSSVGFLGCSGQPSPMKNQWLLRLRAHIHRLKEMMMYLQGQNWRKKKKKRKHENITRKEIWVQLKDCARSCEFNESFWKMLFQEIPEHDLLGVLARNSYHWYNKCRMSAKNVAHN